MQQTNVALQKSLTEITRMRSQPRNLPMPKALTTRLEEKLKQVERQSKPTGLYVVLVAIILFC